MAPPSKTPYLFALSLALVIIGIYAPGIHNDLIFDDLRLREGTIFGQYGNLLALKQRMLSYGSFVWVDAIAGEGWWKQRMVNIALHMAVTASIYAFLKALLQQTRFPEDIEQQEHFQASKQAGLLIGVALFALNPVAVYAVNYLIQRSILMATLFAVMACWAFVRCLHTGRWPWLLLSLTCYIAAVLSKEHAIMTVALAAALYVSIKHPGSKPTIMIAAASGALLLIATAILLSLYGNVIGRLFDPQSVAFAQQLEAVQPGITPFIYPLSILNEAGLFFLYGLLWVLPNPGWLSIDLRPAFPTGVTSSWHLVGAIGYLGLLGASVWAVLRRDGVLSLIGLLLLFPLLWFATEFSTVWIQDPFVLYRSYLWAVALPGLLAIALAGLKPRTIYVLGGVACVLFAAISLERNLSMRDEVSVWGDAAEKVDRQAPASAVGRSRPFLNLGAYYLRQGLLEQAERNLAIASSFGDRGLLGASVLFNQGVVLQQRGKHTQALDALQAADGSGYTGALSLHYHLGESQAALGQTEAAYSSIGKALAIAQNDPMQKQLETTLRMRKAELGIATERYAEAVEDFRTLFATNPGNTRMAQGLGIALVRKGDGAQAAQLFNDLIARRPSASAYYGRAMIHQNTGHPDLALKDLDSALALEPRNAQYQELRRQLAAVAPKR